LNVAYLIGETEILAVIHALARSTPDGSSGGGHGTPVTPDSGKVYITHFIGNAVSVIDTVTDTVSATISVGLDPFGVGVKPDGSKVYVANEMAVSVSVIDTATNGGQRHDPRRRRPPRRGREPQRQQGLCHRRGEHRIGDRHGDEHGDHHDPSQPRPHRRGGQTRRQQGLCHRRDEYRMVIDTATNTVSATTRWS
jgi:YVTN family beta-propeller protein